MGWGMPCFDSLEKKLKACFIKLISQKITRNLNFLIILRILKHIERLLWLHLKRFMKKFTENKKIIYSKNYNFKAHEVNPTYFENCQVIIVNNLHLLTLYLL